ncbi:MAG: putative glycoside hydrolase [Gaiellaceae bacterium]
MSSLSESTSSSNARGWTAWLFAVLAALAFAGSASQPASAASDAHGFPRTFHLWSCDSPEKLAKYDLVVGYPRCDTAKMRSLNPKGIFLLQPQLNGANVHATYGAAGSWTGGCDSIVDGSAANLGCIRAFDSYWDRLRNADGTTPSLSGYQAQGFNLADPMKKGTSAQIAKIYAYAAKSNSLYRKGWDGVFSDNFDHSPAICQSWFFGAKIDTDRNGTMECSGDKVALRKNWDNGIDNFGNLLRRWFPGKTVGGNTIQHGVPEGYRGSTVDGWRKSANFSMIEQTERFVGTTGFLKMTGEWLNFADPYSMPRYVATLHAAQKCTGGDFVIPSGADINSTIYMLDPCVLKSMRWGLTLALLGGAYYELYPHYKHNALWWYDEYDGGVGIRKRGYLGLASGAATKLSSGVYRRNFANGIALHNPTLSAQTVSLGGTYKRLLGNQAPSLNTGASVTSVVIPARDGLILLKPATSTSFTASSKTPTNGQTVKGYVRWEAVTSGATVSKVEFSIDGKLLWTEFDSPYVFRGDTGTWNTWAYLNGTHKLTVKATATDGRTASSTISVTVAN